MATILTARSFLGPGASIDRPLITIEEGRVVKVQTAAEAAIRTTGVQHWDFPRALIVPGLFDIHIHGAAGHDVMEGTADALHVVSAFLASRGVTNYLATTVTASLDTTLRALEGIAAAIERQPQADEAEINGIHIEGPFVSHQKAGMHPIEWIVPPSPSLLTRFWDASRGHISMMTIAPEVDGAFDTIRHATKLGIRCSIGHSNATREQAQGAAKAGATTATHTFNAMRPLDHREPGILGYVLDDSELYSDLICDGIHVDPAIVRLWFKAKGPERAILITDALEAAGMPNGTYKLGNTPVCVQDGRCTTQSGGVLAGSVLTLDEAVTRFVGYTGTDWKTAIRLGSHNPMRMLGIAIPGGAGTEANFNIYDEDGVRIGTILRGVLLRS